jgi:hypothetical protein
MKSKHARTMSLALALLVALTADLAAAGPKPLPPNSNAFGKGYAELTADWLEWVLSIPAPVNPLNDPDGSDAAVGQSGKVWFLVGNTTGGATTRTVSVPAGKAVFLPIINYFWINTPEFGDPEWSPAQEANARAIIGATVDTAHDLLLQIDGETIGNVGSLRVRGAVGACTIPDDNVFGFPFAPGAHPCVSDGYWALLPPLSAGSHTIRFAGGFAGGFALDVTYHITARNH